MPVKCVVTVSYSILPQYCMPLHQQGSLAALQEADWASTLRTCSQGAEAKISLYLAQFDY